MDKTYVLSPYVKFMPSGHADNRLINYMTNRVDYLQNNEANILQKCCTSMSYKDLQQLLSEKRLQYLIQKRVLLETEKKWFFDNIRQLEIETSTVCNWKCQYCPNHILQRKPEYIDINLFQNILKKAWEYGHLQYVTLHCFNEPTIDPNFKTYIHLLGRYDLKLVLFTNGTGLGRTTLQYIKNECSTRNIIFNFPSTDPEIFKIMTGAVNYEQCVQAIIDAKNMGFHVQIYVQCTHEDRTQRKWEVMKLFPGIPVVAEVSLDRGGFLKNQFNRNAYYRHPLLRGCGFMATVVHIDIHGETYLCLEDVEKKYTYGNIADGSLLDIVNSDKGQNLRRLIWGGEEAPTQMICRRCAVMQNDKFGDEITNHI